MSAAAGRVALATRLAFRDQLRRPLLLVLLVVVPFFFITRAIANTLPTPRAIVLPAGTTVLTTMQKLHGSNMAAITVAFLAGLCGVFVMQAARDADRRLVIAGFRPLEAIAPRLLVLAVVTVLVTAVSLGVTALDFEPRQWGWFVAGTLLVAVIYGAIGAIAGAVLGRLGAGYLMFFAPMIDIGIAQNPMFGSGKPPGWATLLPGYGPTQVLLDGAFSSTFHAVGQLAIALGWALAALVAVAAILGRSLSTGP